MPTARATITFRRQARSSGDPADLVVEWEDAAGAVLAKVLATDHQLGATDGADVPWFGAGDDPLGLGLRLTRLLIRPEFFAQFRRLIGETASGRRVEIHLRVDSSVPPDLERAIWQVPWELVCHERHYVLQDERVALIRIADGPAPTHPLAEGPLRILPIIGARRAQEMQRLPQSPLVALLDGVRSRWSLFEVLDPLVSPSLDELERSLDAAAGERAVDLIVFEGHGTPDGICLRPSGSPTDAQGVPVDPQDLLPALAGRTRAALLAACWAGASAGLTGTAEELAAIGIPTVAFQSELEFDAALPYITSVTRSLALGMSIAEATASARHQITRTGHVLAGAGRPVVWQPGPQEVRLRSASGASAPGPRPTVTDERFGEPGWFGERPALGRAIQSVLDDARVRTLDLTGPPGSGRSALLRWWWETSGDGVLPEPEAAILADRHLVDRPPATSSLLRSRVSAALARRTGREAIVAAAIDAGRHAGDPGRLDGVLQVEIDEAEARGRTAPLLILIDGWDEADASLSQELLGLVEQWPPWFRWVSTGVTPILVGTTLPQAAKAELRILEHPDGAAEVLARRLLAPLAAERGLDEVRRLAGDIGAWADGNLECARIVCDQILLTGEHAGGEPPPPGSEIDLARLPAAARHNGLHALYDRLETTGTWATHLEVISVIAICRAPLGLSASEIASLTGRSTLDVRRALADPTLRPLLSERDGRWNTAHSTLDDWARARLGPEGLGAAEGMVASGLEQLRASGRVGGLRTYAAGHLLDHLAAARALLPEHDPMVTSVEAATASTLESVPWLLDIALDRGFGIVAWELERIDAGAATPIARALRSAERLSVLAPGDERWPITALAQAAAIEDHPALLAAASERITAADQHWTLIAHAGAATAPHLRMAADEPGTSVRAVSSTDLVASASGVQVAVWRLSTGRRAARTVHLAERVVALSWTDDRRQLAIALADGTIYRWLRPAIDRPGPVELLLDAGGARAERLAWSADGRRLAIGCRNGRAFVVEGETPGVAAELVGGPAARVHGQLDAELDGHLSHPPRAADGGPAPAHASPVTALAWSRRPGRVTELASGGHDGRILVWDARDPRAPTASAKADLGVDALAWAHHADELAVGTVGGRVHRWHPMDGSSSTIARERQGITALDWSPGGGRLVAGGRLGAVTILATEGSSDPVSLGRHAGAVTSVAWGEAAGTVVSTSVDQTVCEWAIESASGPTATGVTAIGWGPDATVLAVGDEHGSVALLDLELEEQRRWEPAESEGGVVALTWSPTGDEVAWCTTAGTIRVGQVDGTGERTLGVHPGGVVDLAWSPAGDQIASVDRLRAVHLWSTAGPIEPALVARAPGVPASVRWSSDAALVAIAAERGRSSVFEARPSADVPLTEGPASRTTRWEPGGHVVWFTGGDQETTAVDLATGEVAIVLAGSPSIWGRVAWAPDGRHLAVGRRDGGITWRRLNTVHDGLLVAAHDFPVTALAWSPMSDALATGAADGSTRLWRLPTAPPGTD